MKHRLIESFFEIKERYFYSDRNGALAICVRFEKEVGGGGAFFDDKICTLYHPVVKFGD